MKAIDSLIEDLNAGKLHPRHEQLLTDATKALESQAEMQGLMDSGKLTIYKWSKKLIKSMGKFPTGNK
jgi:hypothetical protein